MHLFRVSSLHIDDFSLSRSGNLLVVLGFRKFEVSKHNVGFDLIGSAY